MELNHTLWIYWSKKTHILSSISDQSDHCDTKGYIIVNRESSPALYASTHLTYLLSYCCSRIVDFGSKRAKNIQSLIQLTYVEGVYITQTSSI